MVDLSLCKDYVHHIYSKDDIDGCGIFVDEYFITAGHVGKDDFYVLHEGRKIIFSKEECIFLACEPKCEDDFEIAVFHSKGIISPFRLGRKVAIGDELECYSFRHKGGLNEVFHPIHCLGKVNGVIGNFFLCTMSEVLKEGSSGSPIFKENDVVGILVGCPGVDQKEILFNSISSVLSKLICEIKVD